MERLQQLSSLVFALLLAYCSAQSLPDYWKKVTTSNNGTMINPVPFKIFGSSKEYNKKDSPRDLELQAALSAITASLTNNHRNPTNKPPVNKTGTEHKVQLTDGLITSVEVLDHYNYDGTATVPVKISTSWLKVNEAGSNNHDPFLLEKSVNTGNLLNITLHASWFLLPPAVTQKINNERYWEIDEYLCHYAGTSVEIVNGKCVLPYMEVIQYFIELWQLNFVNPRANAVREQVSNNYDYLKDVYQCSLIPGELTCNNTALEQIEYIPATTVWLPPIYTWYRYEAKPAGIGHAINFTYGYNKTTGSYDLNFTVIFNQWTYDLPEGLLSSFRDFKFNFEDFKYEMWYWVEEPPIIPERPVPESFWIMLVIIILPVAVIILGIVFLICTKTRKGFNLRLWEYWKKQENLGMTTDKMEQIKTNKLVEMAEVRKEKEWEEQEAKQAAVE